MPSGTCVHGIDWAHGCPQCHGAGVMRRFRGGSRRKGWVFVDEFAAVVAVAYLAYRYGSTAVGSLIAEAAYVACLIAIARYS